MADLDELLGDAPPTTAAPTAELAGVDELDGLIGDAAPSTKARVALDDDFLFEDAPKRITGSIASFGSSGSMSSTGAPTRNKSRPSVNPLTAAPSEKLKPFVTPGATYFARYVSVFNADGKRTKEIITLSESEIQLYRNTGADVATPQVERTVAINRIIGVVRQPVLISKSFGFSKEYELHMVLQVEHERDIYLALIFDDNNGPTASSLDIIQTLSALCMAQGVALSVSDLHAEENIESIVKWIDGEDRVRRQFTETLAFRTELTSELQTLARMEGQVAMSIETLRNSSATQAANDLMKDIAQVEQTLAEFSIKAESIERSKTETEKLLRTLQDDLAREEARRAAAVRDTMELSAQASLMRQVTEYEIMKASHKRDIDKIGSVTAFDERRVATRRGQTSYSGNQISLRIDDLEDEEMHATEMRANGAQHRANRTATLAEAKKRLAHAKEALNTLNDDIQTILDVPSSEPLPPTVRLEAAPLFDPVLIKAAPCASKPVTDATKPSTTTAVLPTSSAPVPAPPAVTKPPIDLDDDDDI